MNGHDNDDDFVEESLAPEAAPPTSPEPLIFQPWHKPRKQFVRVKQWMRHIQGVVERLGGAAAFEDGQPLRYLTLPGPDLLDIRMVADFCSSKSIKLRYTGFCLSTDSEEKRLRQNVSEFSLTHQEAVVSSSRVVRKHLQDVGVKDSEAFIEMGKGGPFDVVNIDACAPLAADDQNVSGRLVDTIRSITEYQLRERRKSWLLLLTTPVQANSISQESLEALHSEVVKNTKADPLFATELSEKFDGTDADVAAYLARISATTGEGLISIFSLGLAKWLIHLAEQANFKVIKLDGYSYSMFKRPPFDPNMVSLCFLFEPMPLEIQDNTGLTANVPKPQGDQTPPIPLHLRALRKAFTIQNLDVTLQADTAVNDDMIQQTKALLGAVGYNIDDEAIGYDVWLTSQSQITSGSDQLAQAGT